MGSRDRENTNVFGDETIIHEEEKSEEDMEIEEIMNEPEESEKIIRCKKCRRQKFGHPLPFGMENCQLSRIEDDSELKKDDKSKHEKRKELRNKKRKTSQDGNTSDPKKKKEESDDSSDTDQDLKAMLEEEKKLQSLVKKSTADVKKAEAERKEAMSDELRKWERRNEELRKTIENNKNKESKVRDGAKRKENDDQKKQKDYSPKRNQSHPSSRKNHDRSPSSRKNHDRSPPRRKNHESRSKYSRNDSYQTHRNDHHDIPSRRNHDSPPSRRNNFNPSDYKDWYDENDRDRMDQRHPRRGDYYRESSRQSRRSRERRKSPSHRNKKSTEHSDVNLTVVQELRRIGEERQEDRKIDPPPGWQESISYNAWARSIRVWSDVKAKPQRKTQLLIEMLKKDETRKGLKEMIISEVVENDEFDYKDEGAIDTILEKIKEFMEESEWTRNLALAKDFENFCQKDGETNRDYVGRFSNLETKLRNEKAGISNMFLAGWLMNRSKISQAEKNNILANFDVDEKETVLKNLKKKIRNMDISRTNKDPKETLYGDFRSNNRSKSRSFHRGSRDKSREGSKFNRRNYSNGRSGSRGGKPYQENRNSRDNKDNYRNSRSPNNVKRTYTCENFRVNKNKSIFEEEVENRALVDSGCPEMVCGEEWMKTFEHSTDMIYEKVDMEDNFKFGNEVFKTTSYKKIPLNIGSLEEMVDVGVVPANIPLLISKRKLKDWGARIDFEKNELFLRKTNETVKLSETKSGHLTLKMAKTLPEDSAEFLNEVFLIQKKKSYKMKELKKLHRVFGHPSIEKMEALLKDAGENEVVLKIMRRIHENCRVCKKHRKKASKPKVGLPKAREVNETVSVDLKPVATLINAENDPRMIVYMVDEFSKYTLAGITKNKEADEVAKMILKKWCLLGPGYPNKSFFADNGTEIKKKNLEEMARRIGIKICLTPSYSPWSNGVCERRHGTIDLVVRKLMEDDPNLKLEDALDHAIWAKNIEIGRHGKSPFQIIFGKSPVLPGINDGNVMSDSIVTDAEVVRKHFQNQEKARVEIRKADASRRLKDAIKARIQPYNDKIYELGDKIIFLDKNDQWDGPAIIQAMESKTLFVLHNGNLKKVATCKARPWIEEISGESDSEENDESDTENDETIVTDAESLTNSEIEVQVIEAENEENEDLIENNVDRRPKRGSTVKFRRKGKDNIEAGKVKKVGKQNSKQKDVCWIQISDQLERLDFLKDIEAWSYKEKLNVNFNKENENKVFLVSGEESEELKTKSDAWKEDDKVKDAEGVFYLARQDPIDVLAAIVASKDYGNPEIQEAMSDELRKWEMFGAYKIVDDDGQETIDGRWVVNRKEEHDGLKAKYKARYCLRGFKEETKPRGDSPTVDRISSKIFYAIAANETWKISTIDVTSAFLQGEPIDRDIFVVPPKEANMPGKLWLMQKAAYGLVDASRRWWIKVVEYLISLGGRTLVGDECLLYFHIEKKLVGIVELHVDDFQGAGSDWFEKHVMDAIENKFKLSKRESQIFKYTGIDVMTKPDGSIEINQEAYKDTLETIDIDNNADNERPLNKEEFKKFR